jgi:hypothetical protein
MRQEHATRSAGVQIFQQSAATGDLNMLRESVSLLQSAVAAVTGPDEWEAAVNNNLGLAISNLAEQIGDRNVAEGAVAALRKSIALGYFRCACPCSTRAKWTWKKPAA